MITRVKLLSILYLDPCSGFSGINNSGDLKGAVEMIEEYRNTNKKYIKFYDGRLKEFEDMNVLFKNISIH